MYRSISSTVILGDGLLGTEIIKQTNWKYISRKKDGFDITKKENFKLIPKCDCIINCIAYTDTYSNSKELNWNINYKAVSDLVEFCNENNIKLVHISTDYIYANSNSNASESDIPIHGNNWYSYTKLLADAFIELKSNNYLICRGTHKPHPWPYDNAWVDQVGNFDYVNIIAEKIIYLVDKKITGIVNVGTELKSIYNLACRSKENVLPSLKPNHIPSNVSMNLNQLKNI